VDETPWVVKGVKEWLWIFACPQLPLFHAADTRSRSELETILGKSYNGVLSSDDYCVYNGIEFFEQAILAVVDPCMPTPSLIP
jgi:transposase